MKKTFLKYGSVNKSAVTYWNVPWKAYIIGLPYVCYRWEINFSWGDFEELCPSLFLQLHRTTDFAYKPPRRCSGRKTDSVCGEQWSEAFQSVLTGFCDTADDLILVFSCCLCTSTPRISCHLWLPHVSHTCTTGE